MLCNRSVIAFPGTKSIIVVVIYILCDVLELMKMENQDGKRVARGPGMPRGGKIALAVVLVLVLAAWRWICRGFAPMRAAALCLPNTSIAGVDVSGQSREGAAAALEAPCPACWRTAGPNSPVRAKAMR